MNRCDKCVHINVTEPPKSLYGTVYTCDCSVPFWAQGGDPQVQPDSGYDCPSFDQFPNQ